ncbi:NAD-dependent deacetylase [Microbacterium sp. EYE_5]|uniref:Sir2 family NAD-dependent protein deacetylase n=1 Tax=unclassified Microbacterium TaxID=2609290 RepID=UPI0020036F3A|nr:MULTISPECIES: Sir2 family NAD-dependent protein deacetylase [unclassified Microbacterium]MCK6080539.1 NAD-dependent deacetylase [Microbacterium sp. EYE_382]MCK6085810.1 NAD-dependent deacetylase [Microbacterium sp. EYE_384]MCK6124692.1 NAD-dependent deacetylase [Microbacterium sp. EYE_80]MCK6127601.1 NAD-dependent deacetylase [Microbacterium sp. EYE_79]MCK6141494.1 NAD-dependent deacetylase [Microbacterium sp. EYE_39]
MTVLDVDAAAAVDRAVDALAGHRVAVLTGAGVSTDSGIPDYRGKGAPVRTPMTAQQFLADDASRRRYWVGSHLGWRTFAAAAPNDGHRAIADLERAGVASGVITQNVDGLHLRAGSRRVVELHGTMRRVTCLHCGQVFDRRDLAERIERDNPWITVPENVELGPDGDVLPSAGDDFVVPACSVCGGVLKPEVVFFGEFIPVEKFREAEQLVRGSTALLIAGSSLVVNSGIRLLDRARRRKLPVVIVNRGETRGDARATVKIDAGTSEVLTTLAAALAGRS